LKLSSGSVSTDRSKIFAEGIVIAVVDRQIVSAGLLDQVDDSPESMNLILRAACWIPV
jgi:hypothetical protein